MPKQVVTMAYASNVLVAILVNLKRQCTKKRMVMKVNYNKFHEIFCVLNRYSSVIDLGQFLNRYFVFSDFGPVPFSPRLQEAIEALQVAGMISLPDLQHPDVMELNLSAENWYEKELLANTENRLAHQDVMAAQKIAKLILGSWPELLID